MAVHKHLKSTQFFIPTSFCFYNFAKKINPLGCPYSYLILAVFGAEPGPGLDPDGPGGPEKP